MTIEAIRFRRCNLREIRQVIKLPVGASIGSSEEASTPHKWTITVISPNKIKIAEEPEFLRPRALPDEVLEGKEINEANIGLVIENLGSAQLKWRP